MIDLDKVMQTIRQEIDEKRKATAPGPSGLPPSAAPSDRANNHTETIAMPRSSHRRSLSERINLRRLIYRLLGLRELSRLEPDLRRVRRGPIPLTALPFVVEEMKLRLAGAEVTAREARELSGALAAKLHDSERKIAAAELAVEEARGVSGLQTAQAAQLQSIEDRVAAAELAVEEARGLSGSQTALAAQLQSIEGSVVRQDGALVEHDRGLSEAQLRLAAVEAKSRDNWRNIADQARRLNLLINETRRRIQEPLTADELRVFATEGETQLSALYVSFEDRYRGSREDIKQRQSVYMPHAKQAAVATGGVSFVDIGCGRGEYLELLRNNGLSVLGVDMNPVMTAECRERGLEVVEADALAFLRKSPPASLAGVSGFHIIEHVPHRVLIDLFDEALRVLAPGGLLIFETPNPANLLVAAERFYLDPTHLNPLPSEMVAFMAEARGFINVTVLPLHPVDSPLREYNDPMLALLQEKFYGPQDYGLLAWKAK